MYFYLYMGSFCFFKYVFLLLKYQALVIFLFYHKLIILLYILFSDNLLSKIPFSAINEIKNLKTLGNISFVYSIGKKNNTSLFVKKYFLSNVNFL